MAVKKPGRKPQAAENLASGFEGFSIPDTAQQTTDSTVAAFEPMNQLTTNVDSVMTFITTATQEKLSQLPIIATEQITAVQKALTSGLEQIKSAVSSYVKNTLAAMKSSGKNMFVWLNYNNSGAVGSTRNFEEITDPTPGDEWLQKILE